MSDCPVLWAFSRPCRDQPTLTMDSGERRVQSSPVHGPGAWWSISATGIRSPLLLRACKLLTASFDAPNVDRTAHYSAIVDFAQRWSCKPQEKYIYFGTQNGLALHTPSFTDRRRHVSSRLLMALQIQDREGPPKRSSAGAGAAKPDSPHRTVMNQAAMCLLSRLSFQDRVRITINHPLPLFCCLGCTILQPNNRRWQLSASGRSQGGSCGPSLAAFQPRTSQSF